MSAEGVDLVKVYKALITLERGALSIALLMSVSEVFSLFHSNKTSATLKLKWLSLVPPGREDPLEKEMATHSSTLPGKFHGLRSLAGYNPWDPKESDTFELLHFHFLIPEAKSSSSEITNLTSFIISYQSGALISCTAFHIPGVYN